MNTRIVSEKLKHQPKDNPSGQGETMTMQWTITLQQIGQSNTITLARVPKGEFLPLLVLETLSALGWASARCSVMNGTPASPFTLVIAQWVSQRWERRMEGARGWAGLEWTLPSGYHNYGHPWIQSSCGHPDKIKPVNIPAWKGEITNERGVIESEH